MVLSSFSVYIKDHDNYVQILGREKADLPVSNTLGWKKTLDVEGFAAEMKTSSHLASHNMQ